MARKLGREAGLGSLTELKERVLNARRTPKEQVRSEEKGLHWVSFPASKVTRDFGQSSFVVGGGQEEGSGGYGWHEMKTESVDNPFGKVSPEICGREWGKKKKTMENMERERLIKKRKVWGAWLPPPVDGPTHDFSSSQDSSVDGDLHWALH